MSNKGLATSKAKPVILDLSLPTFAATRVLIQDFSVAAMGFVNVVVVKAFASKILIGTDTFIHEDAVAGEGTVVAVALGGFFGVHVFSLALTRGFHIPAGLPSGEQLPSFRHNPKTLLAAQPLQDMGCAVGISRYTSSLTLHISSVRFMLASVTSLESDSYRDGELSIRVRIRQGLALHPLREA